MKPQKAPLPPPPKIRYCGNLSNWIQASSSCLLFNIFEINFNQKKPLQYKWLVRVLEYTRTVDFDFEISYFVLC